MPTGSTSRISTRRVCASAPAGARVNLLYLVPNFQNPAGILLSLEKRARLLEWAERRNILIVEDDPYGELYFEDVATAAETRPLKADDRNGRVIYLSTFSKTLAPGFRVAWVAAPAPIVERFDTAKQSMDLMCGILDQRVVHQSIVRGVLERQAAPLRELYRTAPRRAWSRRCASSSAIG